MTYHELPSFQIVDKLRRLSVLTEAMIMTEEGDSTDAPTETEGADVSPEDPGARPQSLPNLDAMNKDEPITECTVTTFYFRSKILYLAIMFGILLRLKFLADQKFFRSVFLQNLRIF